jgi:hypothetical protein
MGLLKTTIKLVTTDVFPYPVNITVPAIEAVDLDASFSTVILNASGTSIIYGPIPQQAGTTGNTYFNIQSDPDNVSSVNVDVTDTNNTTITAISIPPGDFAWFPLNADAVNVQVELINTDVANPATVTYFYGEKG